MGLSAADAPAARPDAFGAADKRYSLGFLQPTLEANAPQAAQKNINLEILRALPIPLPPIASQARFKSQCESIFSIQTQQTAATAKASATFDALLATTFNRHAEAMA